jgi:hypothetical protein
MANRRMFAKTIIDSDMFLDMPQTTQNLYFHLNMRADDEGFVNAPKKVMRVIQANQNDLDILVAKRFVLFFESGVLVIKHWKLHNTIRKDRFTKTLYTEEKQQLFEKENGSYTFNRYQEVVKLVSNDDSEYLEGMTTIGLPDGNQLATNDGHRLGKVSIVKSSINLDKDYKENKQKQTYQNYTPNKNKLSQLITEGINHWNSKENLPKCKYTVITLPNNKLSDITNKFDVFREGEILAAIDNLSKSYDTIDQDYRPKNFQNFIVNSLDNWFEERKVEVVRNYRTLEEERYFKYLDMQKETPEHVTDEEIENEKQKCIDSLTAIGEEFIDYEL